VQNNAQKAQQRADVRQWDNKEREPTRARSMMRPSTMKHGDSVLVSECAGRYENSDKDTIGWCMPESFTIVRLLCLTTSLLSTPSWIFIFIVITICICCTTTISCSFLLVSSSFRCHIDIMHRYFFDGT